MREKRAREGYLMIDERAAGGSLVESATITCSHCQRIVVLNPLRSRERGYCPKCDSYICDQCDVVRVARGYECLTMEKRFDRAAEELERHGTVVGI